MPAGRPTLYDPAHCEVVVELGKLGKSLIQMCAHFDISRQTIDNWAAANPEFLEALSRAKVHAQSWWEEQGVSGMTAERFNAAVWKKSVEARFREDYTERKEHELTGKNGGPIQTVDLTKVSPDDLERLEALFGSLAGGSGDDVEGDQSGEGSTEG